MFKVSNIGGRAIWNGCQHPPKVPMDLGSRSKRSGCLLPFPMVPRMVDPRGAATYVAIGIPGS